MADPGTSPHRPPPAALTDLDQSALHVARLGGLHGRVHQSLAAAHRVEHELGRRQARVEAVAHEALGVGRLGCESGDSGNSAVTTVTNGSMELQHINVTDANGSMELQHINVTDTNGSMEL